MESFCILIVHCIKYGYYSLGVDIRKLPLLFVRFLTSKFLAILISKEMLCKYEISVIY